MLLSPLIDPDNHQVTFLRTETVSLDTIRPSAHQPRRALDPLVLESLQASILAVGILQRPRVREMGPNYEVVFGHQRVEACRRLGWTTMMVDVIACDDWVARRMTLHENIKSSRLHPIEHTEAICRFLDATLSHDPQYDCINGDTAVWRVHTILTLLTNVPQDPHEVYPARQFAIKHEMTVRQILQEMAGKEPRSFLNADVSLLQLPDEIIAMAVEKGLKKGQARALGQLQAQRPDMFQDILEQGGLKTENETLIPLERAPVASIRKLFAPAREPAFNDEPREMDADMRYVPVGIPVREEADSLPWDPEGPIVSAETLPLQSLGDAHGWLHQLTAQEWSSIILDGSAGARHLALTHLTAIRAQADAILRIVSRDGDARQGDA
jgi:hypothetical protein